MGAAARSFVDFLVKAGQAYWQILPVCPTSYGDSPYQSFSTFAGNPYFIDLDDLAKQGLLLPEEYASIDWECPPDCINYGVMYEKRYAVLRCAAKRLLAKPGADYCRFVKENDFWLPDYALFMALKDAHNGACWLEWEETPPRPEPADEVDPHGLGRAVQRFGVLHGVGVGRGAQQHGNVGIVAAGVHNAVNGGLIGQIVLLGDRKSVHVAADEDGLAGLAALYGGQYAGLKTTLYVRHGSLIKFGLDELAGFIFLGAEFGVHVEVSAGLDDVVAVLLSSFLDVHNMPFLFRRVRGVIADE